MSTPTPSAMRERILNHMNEPDHTDHLRLYLQHYNKLPASSIGTPKMTDITLSSITLSTGSNKGTYHIPLSPPMSDLREARERLTQMVFEAEPAAITRWYTNSEGVIVGASVLFGLWATWDGERQCTPGGFVREMVFRGNAEAAEFVNRWKETIFWLIIGIHVVEATALHFTRLTKHKVRTGTGLWWAWMASAFFEGYPAFKRIDKEVKRIKNKESEKKEH